MYSTLASQVNMMLVVPYSVGGISFIPRNSISVKKHGCRTKCSLSRRSADLCSPPCKCLFSLSASIKLFSQFERQYPCHHISRIQKLCATGTDVAVEEANSPILDEKSGEASEISSSEVKQNESSSSSSTPEQTRRARARRSEMPPVKNEELVPGAVFNGKVRSIQPFGAFIDFGAFTDGLVHVSMLSDSYVKNVDSVVSVGQEVKVKLVEANMETGRISLSMRDSDESSKLQQQNDGPSRGQKPRPSRRNSSKPGQKRDEVSKASKFVQGQILEGTVKNMARAGAFISLPDGEEGFLPTSEESDEGFESMMGGSSLQVGQEVSVRVLRITRGQVTLTMKKEEDGQSSGSQITQGVVHVATNPFVVAFRKNKDIAIYLDEREKLEKEAQESVKPGTPEATEDKESLVAEITTIDPALQESPTPDEEMINMSSLVDETVSGDISMSKDTVAEANVINEDEDSESIVAGPSKVVDGATQTMEKEVESSEVTVPEGSQPPASQITEEAPSIDGANSNEQSDPLGPESKASEGNSSISSSDLQPALSTTQKDEVDSEDSSTAGKMANEEVLVNQFDNEEKEVQIKDSTAETVISLTSQTEEEEDMGSTPEENSSATVSSGQAANSSPENNVTKATISPALVKQLREETGAGMMDCKKALSESGGDIIKAQEYLRKKGLASADKKASRATAEGRIGSYIHDSRIGVLIEVNCETDFVSRGDIFKELVDDLAMQVAACPQVEYLTTEDVPEDIVSKEKEIEMQKEDLLSKPEQIREKIVEGRIRKRLEELVLLEQPFIKDDKVVVKDWVKQTIAKIGENMKVKRFVRYNLGEGLKKKSQDFAAEVAAQTAAKPATRPEKEQPTAVETKDTDQKSATVAVSAALVKQLREETGAGMMDCKKALSETGGDLEKAQEYLRKKGLSTADKKSSRLAAEGRIGSYIHDSRIGVLIEVNCETDFVGRSEKFKELVDDLAMQIVACPQVQFISVEEIPENIVNKEKELEMQREDLLSKPENIREKIVEGRISKRLGELALLEQPFIKDDNLLVKDLVKQTVAALGENIKVRRFVRFTLGETDNTKPETEA